MEKTGIRRIASPSCRHIALHHNRNAAAYLSHDSIDGSIGSIESPGVHRFIPQRWKSRTATPWSNSFVRADDLSSRREPLRGLALARTPNMPIVTIQVTREESDAGRDAATSEEEEALIKEVSELLLIALNQPHYSSFVVVKEVVWTNGDGRTASYKTLSETSGGIASKHSRLH
jgi:phenylpyruvate tautomerase PptA (4-oxalocrotonate tautomerase family)